MDSEHRHELKENDLAEFFSNFGEFWKKYGNSILIAILIVTAVFAGRRFLNARSAAAHEDAWRELAVTMSPPEYRGLAQDTRNDTVRTLAYLRGADKLLAQAVAPAPPANTGNDAATAPVDPGAADRQRVLDEAAGMYQQVITISKHPLFSLNARLGLAAVHEARHELGEARQQYESIAADAAQTYPMLAAQSRARLAMLDRLAMPILFAPDPPADAAPAMEALPGLHELDGLPGLEAPLNWPQEPDQPQTDGADGPTVPNTDADANGL